MYSFLFDPSRRFDIAWKYEFEDKTVVEGLPYNKTVEKIVEHYDGTGDPCTPSWAAALLQHQMCYRLPDHYCRGTAASGDKPKKDSPKINVFTLIEGITAIGRMIMRQRTNMVDPIMASRRAAVCATCPENMPELCTACNHLSKLVKEVTGGQKVPGIEKLGGCRVCGCVNEIKVQAAPHILRKLKKHDYPDNCWIIKEGIYDD